MAAPTILKFEDIRIPVPWGYVEGRWYGNRKVRPILALHGWLDNIGTWDTLIPLLPTHIGMLCVDLPGHGRSSKYPKGMTYYVTDYVHIIMRVMKEYNWQKVSLMGHSLGSIVCFIYTSLYARTVDMVIALDIINPRYHTPEFQLNPLVMNVEKSLVEDERLDMLALQEPPSYTYERLEQVLYKGSRESVDLKNCKYILNRSIAKSSKYPDRFYFSRDGKVKFYVEYTAEIKLSMEMAKKIRNVPYLVVKGSRSNYITDNSNAVIEILREHNPHFELHVIEGTHHVHLNNPEAVAAVLNPFIQHHRPVELNSWTIDQEGTSYVDTKPLKITEKTSKEKVKHESLFTSKL